MYGHVKKLAEAEKAGIEAAGGTADLYQYVLRPAADRGFDGNERTDRNSL